VVSTNAHIFHPWISRVRRWIGNLRLISLLIARLINLQPLKSLNQDMSKSSKHLPNMIQLMVFILKKTLYSHQSNKDLLLEQYSIELKDKRMSIFIPCNLLDLVLRFLVDTNLNHIEKIWVKVVVNKEDSKE